MGNRFLKRFMDVTDGNYFYVVDTETTGLEPELCDVIEVSAIRVYNDGGTFIPCKTFDMFINPGYPLPENIVEFNEKAGTGISDDFLKNKPDAATVAKLFADFLMLDKEKPVVVGHNIVAFDMPFLKKLMKVGCPDKEFEPVPVDTLTISRAMYSGSHSLGNLFKRTERIFTPDGAVSHRSLDDCRMTLDVLNMELKDGIKRSRIAEVWENIIIPAYKKTATAKPSDAISCALKDANKNEIREALGVVARFKDWDERFDVETRSWLYEGITGIDKADCSMDYFHIGKTDEIHTTHLNQIANELKSSWNDLPDPEIDEPECVINKKR